MNWAPRPEGRGSNRPGREPGSRPGQARPRGGLRTQDPEGGGPSNSPPLGGLSPGQTSLSDQAMLLPRALALGAQNRDLSTAPETMGRPPRAISVVAILVAAACAVAAGGCESRAVLDGGSDS